MDLKNNLVPASLCMGSPGQGHFPVDQVVQSPVQTILEHFQAGPSTGALNNLTVKNFFLIFNVNMPSLNLKLFLIVLTLPALS